MDDELDELIANAPDEFFEARPIDPPIKSSLPTLKRPYPEEETKKESSQNVIYKSDDRSDDDDDVPEAANRFIPSIIKKPSMSSTPPQPVPKATETTDPNSLLSRLLSRTEEERAKAIPIVFDEQQEAALTAIMEGKNIVIIGPAGSGKSVLLREADNRLTEASKVVNCVAHNGVAAANINGMTVHSYFGLGRQVFPPYNAKGAHKDVKARIIGTNSLIVDEISTLPAHSLDGLDLYCRQITDNMSKPFGGIQIILCGDFHQLKPVDDTKKRTKAELALKTQGTEIVHRHKEQYEKLPHHLKELMDEPGNRIDLAYKAKSWKYFEDNIFMLEKAYRQGQDPLFLSILTEARQGSLSDASHRALLARVVDPRTPLSDDYTVLFSLRKSVIDYNAKKMQGIAKEKGRIYKCVDHYENEFYKSLLANIPLQEALDLRLGCRVMQKRNISKTIVNGTCGTVIGFATAAFADSKIKGLLRPVNGLVFSNPGCITCRQDIPPLEDLELPKGAISVPLNQSNPTVVRREDILHRIKAWESLKTEISLLTTTGFLPLPVVLFDNGECVVSTPSEWAIEINRRVKNDAFKGDGDDDFAPRIPAAAASRLAGVIGGKQKKAKRTRVEKVKLAFRIQIPLQIAYAVSIHASQGLTIPKLAIDLGNSIFEDGQAYVALSRGTSLNGLVLIDYSRKKITADSNVKEFYSSLKFKKREKELQKELDKDTRPDDELSPLELMRRMMMRARAKQ